MKPHLLTTLFFVITCGHLFPPIFAQVALTCGAGQYVATNGAGNEICQPCAEDTYKIDSGAPDSITECTPCPEDMPRNHVTGSWDPADCRYAACGQGQQYNQSNFLECLDCDVGTYQDKTYPLDFDICEACPAGMSTASTLSMRSDCYKPCGDGLEYNAITDTCHPCAINYYKNVSALTRGEYRLCVQCPDASYRTASPGATSESDCNILTCNAGTYTDEVNNRCVECGVDEYQNEDWMLGCNECPMSHGTLEGVTGANDISLCHRYCPDGEELVGDICERCPIGYYKNNDDGRFENCTVCPDPDFITEGTGSTNLANCSIISCSSGSYRNTADNSCQPCPFGQYQPQQWQTSCISCPAGETTDITGAQSQSDCVPTTEHTYLVDIATTIVCSLNPELKDVTSALYSSLNARVTTIVRNIIDFELTDVFVASVDASTAQLVGFRCFDDVLNILLQVQVDSTEMDSNVVETALQDVLTTNMADGSLDNPQGNAAAIGVNETGITEDHIAQSTDLSCSDGYYTTIPSLRCIQCQQGSYQPETVPELCFPCPLGLTTAGRGAIGEEEDLCLISNPDDYIVHLFQVEISTTIQCTILFTESTTDTYQSLYLDAEIIIRNILLQEVEGLYRLNTPVITFVGYRCNSPLQILLQIQMTNLETESSTVSTVLSTINNHMSNGTLSDPQNTENVEDIPVNTGGATSSQTLITANLNCPDGQQTDLVLGLCVDCPQGTYNPQGVPELCYDCPVDTTTTGSGTILTSGNDPQSVCTVTVTDPPIIIDFTLSSNTCPYYLWNSQCVTNCPYGYVADDANVCIVDVNEGSSEERRERREKVSDLGIALTVGLGCAFFVMLVVFILCCCMHRYPIFGRRRRRRNHRDDKRYLDEEPEIDQQPRGSPINQSRDASHDVSHGWTRGAPLDYFRDASPGYLDETEGRGMPPRYGNRATNDRGARAYSPYYHR